MLWCSGNVLVALGQPPQLSWRAQEFVRLTVPAIYLLWMFEVMKQALQAQGIIRFNLAAALAMNITNAALCWALTRDPARAFEGIAVARTIATGVLVVALAALIRWRGLYDAVWPAEGWSWRALQRWGRFLRFALPGCLMTCIDWWAFEVLTLVTGFLPKPETAMAANMVRACVRAVHRTRIPGPL
jgi:MATE family multidrug resistance protein